MRVSIGFGGGGSRETLTTTANLNLPNPLFQGLMGSHSPNPTQPIGPLKTARLERSEGAKKGYFTG